MPIDSQQLSDAYEDVRSDNTPTTWAAFGYNENNIISLLGVGDSYDELLSLCEEDQRWFAYVRVETGDEMSRRAKFALLTWIGKNISSLKKAKMSTDKADVKKVCTQISVEVLGENLEDLDFNKLKEKLVKAGGANYGTGVRE